MWLAEYTSYFLPITSNSVIPVGASIRSSVELIIESIATLYVIPFVTVATISPTLIPKDKKFTEVSITAVPLLNSSHY